MKDAKKSSVFSKIWEETFPCFQSIIFEAPSLKFQSQSLSQIAISDQPDTLKPKSWLRIVGTVRSLETM